MDEIKYIKALPEHGYIRLFTKQEITALGSYGISEEHLMAFMEALAETMKIESRRLNDLRATFNIIVGA